MDKETSEITKLTERISKDPKSKLFVPLAEEYKKAGDIEMAVHVLTEGLKNNPSYVTARSFLGKLLIEEGNLIDAQKEFEEVIKTIPDNLMAQRKLGDTYALQNKPTEALKHYKAVLAINPKDAETAMLITEAEAGRDIRKLVPGPKVSAAPAGPAVKQEGKQPVTAASTPVPSPPAVAAPAVPHPDSEEAEEVLVVEPLLPEDAVLPVTGADVQERTSGAFDFLAESEPQAATDTDATDSADLFALSEHVAAVEEAPAEELPSTMDPFPLTEEPLSGFAEAAAAEAVPAEAALAEAGPSLEFGEPFVAPGPAAPLEGTPIEVPPLESSEPFAFADDKFASGENVPVLEAEPFEVEMLSAPGFVPAEEEPIDAFVIDEPLLAAEVTEAEGQGEAILAEAGQAHDEPVSPEEPLSDRMDESDVVMAEVIEEPEKQADDFTTDTLAELYISQGFFEKAIDIYERMLADHPNSAGLKDKLTHVRAMAAAADQADAASATQAVSETETEMPDAVPAESAPGADVFVPPPPGFAQPRLDDWELPATHAVPISTDDVSSSRPAKQHKPFDLGFEPREYIPPDALPRKTGTPDRTGGQATAPVAATAPAGEPEPANRKETVERLESWLKNIIKEN